METLTRICENNRLSIFRFQNEIEGHFKTSYSIHNTAHSAPALHLQPHPQDLHTRIQITHPNKSKAHSQVSNETPMGKEYEVWWDEAYKHQLNLLKHMGNRIWDEFRLPSQKHLLFQKIAVALYWLPDKVSKSLDLTLDQEKRTKDILDKLISKGMYVHVVRVGVAFIDVFISENLQTKVPLFRVMARGDCRGILINQVHQNRYIDHIGRIYNNWERYLQENTWGNYTIVYPEFGCYAKQAIKTKYMTHEQNTVNDVKEFCAWVGLDVKVGGVTTYFTPSASVEPFIQMSGKMLGGMAAAIGVVQNVDNLADLETHEQDILSKDAFDEWLGLVKNSVNLLLAGANVINTDKLENIGFNVKLALYYFNGKDIYDNTNNWNNLSTLQRFQLGLTMLLFSHTTFEAVEPYWKGDQDFPTEPLFILSVIIIG